MIVKEKESTVIQLDVYLQNRKNMKFLITGSNGFLGKTIYTEVSKFGEVDTLNRKHGTYAVDLAEEMPEISTKYDVVVHCAGKAHTVPSNEMEAAEFYNINLNGTKNLIKGLEVNEAVPKAIVFISSVSVYGLSYGTYISETEPLRAKDPYGKSKILAEQLLSDWCLRKQVRICILRLPLLIGRNAPGNFGAMKDGISKGYYFNIGGGSARKSMVLVEDVANMILPASRVSGIFNLTDGYHPTFKELSHAIAERLGKKRPMNLPLLLAKVLSNLGELIGRRAPLNVNKLKKITSSLTFDDSKARTVLNWQPRSVLNNLDL